MFEFIKKQSPVRVIALGFALVITGAFLRIAVISEPLSVVVSLA